MPTFYQRPTLTKLTVLKVNKNPALRNVVCLLEQGNIWQSQKTNYSPGYTSISSINLDWKRIYFCNLFIRLKVFIYNVAYSEYR